MIHGNGARTHETNVRFLGLTLGLGEDCSDFLIGHAIHSRCVTISRFVSSGGGVVEGLFLGRPSRSGVEALPFVGLGSRRGMALADRGVALALLLHSVAVRLWMLGCKSLVGWYVVLDA